MTCPVNRPTIVIIIDSQCCDHGPDKMLIVRMQAAIAKKYCEEQLPGSLASLEAMLKLNKNGDGFFVGDAVKENTAL